MAQVYRGVFHASVYMWNTQVIALLKGRYVGPRVLERFDAALTNVVEGEVQEHWCRVEKASNGQGVFPHHRECALLELKHHPSWLVQLCLKGCAFM